MGGTHQHGISRLDGLRAAASDAGAGGARHDREASELNREELEAGPAFAIRFKGIRDACYPLRDRYITDPEFATAPLEPFLDPTSAAAGGAALREGGDTVYLCAADEYGNLVSLIQSVAFDFGSGIVAEGTGMLLQNRGSYFSLDPAHVNRLEPRKRTMHTLIPALATRDGRPWASFGTMGGDGQPQLQSQVLVNLVDFGLDPAEAVARPRIRVQAGGLRTSVEADYPGAGSLARSSRRVRADAFAPSLVWPRARDRDRRAGRLASGR